MADQWGMNDAIVNPKSTPDFGANDEIDQDNPLKRGWNKMKQSVGLTADLAKGDYKSAAEGVAAADSYQRQNPGTPEGKAMMQAWQRGDGISGGIEEVGKQFSKDWNAAQSGFGAVRSVAKNLQAMGSGVLEQTPNMIAPMGAQLAGGALGATAGSQVPIVGTAIGGLAGMWSGASLGNAAVEGGGMAQEALQSAGINPQDKAATEAYLSQNGDKLLGQAGVKGGIIGAIDTMTMKLGHGLLTGPAKAASERAIKELGIDIADKEAVKAASGQIAAKVAADPVYKAATTGAGNMARNAGVAAMEPAGEFAGEYAGQGVATGNWDEKNAFLEAASSIGQGAATFAGQKLYAGAKSQFGEADPIVQPPAQPPAGQTPTGGPGLPPAPTAPAAPPLTQAANIAQPGTTPVVDQTAPATAPSAQSQQPVAPPPTPAEKAGINANAGPLSAAAATAVNSGITPITAAAQATPQEIDPVEAARQEDRAQTVLLQQQEDDMAYQSYLEALNESESAIDEAPGETAAVVSQFAPTPEIDIFADYADLSDDDFFAQMGATPEETADAIASQPSNTQTSDENPAGLAPDVATSPSPSAPAVDAKAANLARIRAANEQNTAQGTDTTPDQAPGEAPQDVAGDAAATGGVPAAGTGAVEGIGVDESMRSNLSTLPVAPVEQAQVATDIAAKEQAAQKAYSAHRKEFLAQFTGSDLKQNEKFVIAAEHKFSAGRIRSLKGGKTVEVADRTDGSATRYMMGPSGDFIPVQVVELGSTATYQPNNTPTAQQGAPSGVTSTPALTKTEQAKADLEHLFGLPEKRAKAIERIAKGTAYFSKPLKAQEFIAKNGLKDTHQSVKTARGWDIVAKNSQPTSGTTSEKATEAQPAQVESAVLPPELSAKLQEAHKAHGRDVTQAKVQKAYDRTLNEVLTGTGNNGGVKYKIKPIQMAELKQKLNRLENDLSLFGIQPTGTTNEPQTSVAQQTSQKGSQPQGAAATTDKPAANSGVAATGKAEVGPVDGKARNSPPMQELNGFKVGDTVDVPSRTTGRSKITRLYTTRLAGFSNPEPMATIEHSGGKLLDLNLSSLVAVQDKPEIVVDKAEIRPYRKPDGSVGYEAVPIVDEKQETEKPGAVNVPPTVAEAFTAQMQKQKGRITRLKNEAEKAGSLEDKRAAQLKVTAAEATLRQMRLKIFDAEDAAVKSVAAGGTKEFAEYADLFPVAAEEIAKLTGQNDELDAETRSYEAKANPTYDGKLAKEFAAMKVGDFYEIEGDNAKEAATILSLTLTKNRNGVPIVGWPYHAHERMLAELAANGISINTGETQLPSVAESKPAGKFAPHNAIASEYGYTIADDGQISTAAGKEAGVKVVIKGSRFQIRSIKTDDIVFSGATVDSMGKFLESYWGAEKTAKVQPAAQETTKPYDQARANAPKPAPSANTIFTEDAAAAARARLKAKLGRLNSGLDPEMMMDGITLAGYHMEKGARTFAAFARAMVDDLGDAVKPYLKSWYSALRYDPRASGFTKGMSSAAMVDEFDMNDVAPASDATQSDMPTEKAGTTKPTLETTEGRHEIAKLVADHLIGDGKFSTIIEARKFISEKTGEKIEPGTDAAKRADEAIELGVVIASRDIVQAARKQGRSDSVIFDRLLGLYNNQPSLNVRDSVSLRNQAYSTPVPLAFVASRLANVTPTKKSGEPTAGNGALMMEADPATSTVNEIQDDRLEALRSQGFNPSQNDAATMAFEPKTLESMVMNPPFGAVNGKKWAFGDFTTGEVDHAIALNSLEALKDDGDAVMIIGGTLAREDGARKDAYRGKAKREFFYKLYNEYNVVDHFTVSGDLYKKQGAAYPVDVLVIKGRGKSSRGLPAAQLPKLIDTWEQLKEKLNEAERLGSKGPRDTRGGASDTNASNEPGQLPVDPVGPPAGTGTGQPGGSQSSVGPADRGGAASDAAGAGQPTKQGGKPDPLGQRGNDSAPKTDGNTRTDANQGSDQQQGGRGSNQSSKPDGVGTGSSQQPDSPGIAEVAESGRLQVKYGNFSENKSVNTLVATNHLSAIENAFKRLQERVGDIDEFVRAELQYEPEQFAKSFSAEQVEALALAIDNIGQGKGFIIGDQTGIGKGRVVAAMIRYAKLNGKTPVFVTQMPDLYGDMMRDLNDIGMSNIKPLMTNNNASVPLDSEALAWFSEKQGIETRITELNDAIEVVAVQDLGGKLEKMDTADRSKAIKAEVTSSQNPEIISLKEEITELKASKPERRGKFLDTPDIKTHEDALSGMVESNSLGDHDVIFTTYNQMAALDSGKPKKDAQGRKTPASQPTFGYRNTFLKHFINSNTMLILDESHNAGAAGDGKFPKLGDIVRGLINQSGGVFYSSATFAKNTEVMDVYSKTDLGSAFSSPAALVSAVNSVPMQQITSAMLVEAGQYLRRERSFDGIEYKTETVDVDQQASEDLATAMRLVVAFDEAKKASIEELQNELDAEGAAISTINGGGSSASVESTNFTSVMHNVVGTFLLALKADATAKLAIDAIRNGEKPIITVANTMEMFISEYAKEAGIGVGDKLNATFADVMKRYLDKTRKARIKHANGDTEVVWLEDSQLGQQGVEAYEAAFDFIDSMNMDIPLSPIDHIKQRIQEAGFSIGEITGRQTVVENGVLKGRDKSEMKTAGKKNTIAKYNGGPLDALIINRSGSTGLSMHASATFADQRRRVMIVAQAELDINNHMQMLGRINRTGQVTTGPFDNDTEGRKISLATRRRNAIRDNIKFNASDVKAKGGYASPAKTSLQVKHAKSKLAKPQPIEIDAPTEDGKAKTYQGRAAQYGLPRYVQMTANVPIELRPAAVLSNKMAGLNANTTAGRNSAVEDKAALDFMNKYGDRVAAEMVGSDYNLNASLGFPVRFDEHGDPFVPGSMGRVTGRIGLLPLTKQSSLYRQLASEYGDLLSQLDALGQNDLEAKTYPLDAQTLESKIVSKADKGSVSPFTSAVVAEKVSMKKLGKPYPKAKVIELVNAALDGNDARQLQSKTVADVKDAIDAEIQVLNTENATADTDRKVGIKKHIESLIAAASRFRSSLPPIGQAVMLKTSAGNMYGVVSGVERVGKAKSAGSLSAWKVRIAVVDGARSMTLPMTQIYVDESAVIPENGIVMKIATDMTIPNAERTGFDSVPVLDAFDRGQTDSRETRIVITGNILRGYGALRGRLLNYTDNKGGIKQGILMPPDFDMNAVSAKFTPALRNAAAAIELLKKGGTVIDKANSGDTLRIEQRGTSYNVEVSKTGIGKRLAKNADYNLNFVSSGNKMRTRVWSDEDLIDFLDNTVKKEGIVLIPNADSVKLMQDDDAVNFSRSKRPVFSRGAQTQANAEVSKIVDAIRANWDNAPEIVVAFDMNDPIIPERVRLEDKKQRSGGAAGTPEGFYYKGKVYLMSSQLPTSNDVARVLFHETLGHYGLRGHFGGALKPILQQIVTFRKALVEAKMKEYGLRNVSNMDRLVAAEEVLAEMAQNTPEIGFVQRAIAAIRNWLRANVPGFQSMKMTDNDIIANFILPARDFVERGQGKADGGAMFSRSTVSGYTKHATDKLNEAFNHPGTLSFWHKTVGSMYDLSERSKPFKRVFDAAQSFIQDVSFYATEAADLAPKILPKLDTWKDMLKTPVSSEDNKAISAPILQGTLSWARNESGEAVRIEVLEEAASKLTIDQKSQRLLRGDHISEGVLKMWRGLPIEQYEAMIESKFKSSMLKPGIVFTDAELVKHFSLNKDQISLYREFRSATDKSLDNLAKADLLRFGGKDVEHLRDMVMDAATADDAAVMLRDDLHSQRDLMPDRADDLTAAANGMIDRADKVNKLKKEGYAPLSRFGRYSVDVVVDGERQYFSLFESKQAANVMAMKLKAEFGAANVAQGTMSQKDFEQFQGITPESLELFGNMLGLDSTGNEAQDKAFQTYLKLTKSNRSAMKRMIHRKGTTGFSEDIGRVLAAFVYSNARQTSAALHMGEIGEAVNAVDKNADGTRNGQGELKDAAIELSSYIKKPREEAQALRGMLFAQYLGGSVASAFVNFTQPLTVSFPYLSQFGGAAKSGAALVQAMKDQRAGKVLEAGLAQALRKAEEEGIVSPQSVHELMAQAQGRSTLNAGDGTRLGDAKAFAQNNFAKLTIGWGKLFGLAEQINRRSTFIAAYRIAVDQKIANPGAFATKAVNETQFISNKANKAKFGRGAIGATLMTFKSYSINYLELLHRMSTQNGPEGKKAAALMLGMLFLMAGAGGLPFDDDLEDLADFFAQRLGYNFSSKKAKQEFLEGLFGKSMAQFIDKGISGLPGSPIDTSGRMSMGNMIPGTGLLLTKRDHTGDLKELAGPVGDLIQRGFQGADKLLSGDVAGAAKAIAPKAVYNALKGADMADSGAYNDDKGYKVISSTPFEAAMKAIGFQPASVAEVQQSNYLNQRAKDFYSIKSQAISAKWAKGIYEKDPGQITDAKGDIAAWNEKNPDQRMRPNMSAILKRVHEMHKDKAQRIADTAPKAMRAQMKRDLATAG